MDFDLQITCQSYIFYENLTWSHGHYGHFALGDSLQTHDESLVFDKSVERQFFKKSGAQFGVYIRRFNTASAANSMKIRSGLDQTSRRGPEHKKIWN